LRQQHPSSIRAKVQGKIPICGDRQICVSAEDSVNGRRIHESATKKTNQTGTQKIVVPEGFETDGNRWCIKTLWRRGVRGTQVNAGKAKKERNRKSLRKEVVEHGLGKWNHWGTREAVKNGGSLTDSISSESTVDIEGFSRNNQRPLSICKGSHVHIMQKRQSAKQGIEGPSFNVKEMKRGSSFGGGESNAQSLGGGMHRLSKRFQIARGTNSKMGVRGESE